MLNTYFSMHNHSWFSNIRLLDSINRPDELIKYAAKLGLSGVCLTDHEALSGHVQFVQAYKKLKENGEIPQDFKIGLGDEIYLVDETDLDELKENYKAKNPDTRFYHFLLVAKDLEGYRQLRKLSSRAWEHMFSTGFMERVPTFKSDFAEILKGGHVVGTSGCLGGFLPSMIVRVREADEKGLKHKVTYYKKKIDTFIRFCVQVLGKENFFFELQPTPNEDQYYVNRYLINLSGIYDIKYTIATDAHYLKKEDREAHKIYLQSTEGDREVDDFYSSTYLMSAQEIREYMRNKLSEEEIEEGFKTTLAIMEDIEQYDLFHKTIIPRTVIPEFKIHHVFKPAYDQFEYIKNFASSKYKIDQYFLYLIEEGFNEKIRSPKLAKEYFYRVMDRINTELKEIWKISIKLNDRLSSYYVLTKKIVDLVWSDGDSIVGVSRGSAGGFLINFLLGIIQMNPLDYGLPHFRHLTAERPELPDIDIDSQRNRRQQVLQALKNYFGERQVLNIATFSTEGSKSALLSAARGLGIDVDESSYMASLIPSERGKTWSLHDCFFGNDDPDVNRKPIKDLVTAVEQFPKLKETALKIEGTIKNRSIHASGVYVYNDDYTEFNAMMKSPKGQPTTQFDMDDSNYMGNLKVDMLTVKNLDIIRACLDMLIKDDYLEWQGNLRNTYNKYLHPDALEYHDPTMWRKVGDNSIPDLFQFDTPVGLECAKKVRPTNVVELAAANSLMRLMPEDGEQPVDKYIRHKEHPEQWIQEMKDYGLNDEEIEIIRKHLDEVYGVADSQESVMLLSMDKDISNFTVAESNRLRKGISKKKKKIIDEVKKLFYEKGESNGS